MSSFYPHWKVMEYSIGTSSVQYHCRGEGTEAQTEYNLPKVTALFPHIILSYFSNQSKLIPDIPAKGICTC